MKTIYLKKWELYSKKDRFIVNVPGDISIDFYKNGRIPNPYFGKNYHYCEEIAKTDFTYEYVLEVTKSMLCEDTAILTFKGIDLLSAIYVNDKKVGETNNAFLSYSFDIKKYLHIGKNIIRVNLKSTIEAMNKIDTKNYYAIFNIPRIFLRKPQCHFGWDWAPKICAYGIIDDVFIEFKSKYQIENVQIIADIEGNTIFNVRVNYDNKNLYGSNDEILKKGETFDNDKIIYRISKSPYADDYETFEFPLMGHKNYFANKFKNRQLWWPNGYGDQPLYNYIVELHRGNKKVDEKRGRFAYRTISIKEEAKGNNLIGMDFYINNTKIFLKGSNWVPPECFTGAMTNERYKTLINLAKDMNANILRVWGGGAYEKDIFYELCDESGILVWQDIAFACADIPEDEPEFLKNVLNEVKYQTIRLRNHPSIIYWCGGNEKTGCYGNCITFGDNLVNSILPGIINNLDSTRPYRRQSPHSYSDIGNDLTSGDSHYNNFEATVQNGFETYRERIASKVVPFVSECAVLGPSSVETLKKIFPEDKLWPINDLWADRFMRNPYCSLPGDFAQREYQYATKLHGQVSGLSDFVLKAMDAQAQSLRLECEYNRANSKITGAFLNWMFDDIWPSGTWSTVDYYLEPKHAYYQLRKSFSPVLVSFYEDKNKKTHLFVSNQSSSNFKTSLIYGVKTYDGKVLYKNKIEVNVNNHSNFDKIVALKWEIKNIYLFAYYAYSNQDKVCLYSPTMYQYMSFKNDFDYSITKINDKHIQIHITAKSFIKSLFIHFKDNYLYNYSDNYLDLEKGQTFVVDITSVHKINEKQILFDSLK